MCAQAERQPAEGGTTPSQATQGKTPRVPTTSQAAPCLPSRTIAPSPSATQAPSQQRQRAGPAPSCAATSGGGPTSEYWLLFLWAPAAALPRYARLAAAASPPPFSAAQPLARPPAASIVVTRPIPKLGPCLPFLLVIVVAHVTSQLPSLAPAAFPARTFLVSAPFPAAQ
ncbi:hypothetical protein CDD83_6352 [Cordyceps sp. RAO-2017]|nr:hypothetical protein CDD83_6352 [Cordyceps sp. RAO-2017]